MSGAPPPYGVPPVQPLDPKEEKRRRKEEKRRLKEEPWGPEDPMSWCTRWAWIHALWGSAAIAVLITIFGSGMYGLFTAAVYEGDIEGNASLILLFLSPFILAIVGAVATYYLAKTAKRISRLPGAPRTTGIARGVLVLAMALWLLLIIMFPASAAIKGQPSEEGGEDFPVGIITVLPVYMGLCFAVYTSGAVMLAFVESNRVEALTIIGLGWAGFAVFLILPATVSSWDFGSQDINYDEVIFWLRFGNLFPVIVPWLVILGLNYVHKRRISLLGAETPPHPETGTAPTGGRGICPECGGALSVHPITQEVFCTACGAGLRPEGDVVVDATAYPVAPPEQEQAFDRFVEQRPPAPEPPAPPAKAEIRCNLCGGKLSTLTMTGHPYCTACGAGLQSAPAPHPGAPRPQGQPSVGGHRPGTCVRCGGPLSVHPRTQEVFCTACGAGLMDQQEVPWPPP